MQAKRIECVYQTLLVAGLAIGLSALIPAGSALAKGEPDHLQCYDIRDSNPPVGELVRLLNQQFGLSDCKVNLQAVQLCAPTAKFSKDSPDGDDPRGGPLETDFMCYRVSCRPANSKLAIVSDQFGERKAKIGLARTICTPTKKELIPTPTP